MSKSTEGSQIKLRNHKEIQRINQVYERQSVPNLPKKIENSLDKDIESISLKYRNQ